MAKDKLCYFLDVRMKTSMSKIIEKSEIKLLQQWSKEGLKVCVLGDFPGGPVVKTALPMQGVQVWSLARELDPTCPN